MNIKTRSDGLQEIGNNWVGKLDEVDMLQIQDYLNCTNAWKNPISKIDACIRIDMVLTRTAVFKIGKFTNF